MSDPTPIEDQAAAIAERRHRAKEQRMLNAAIGLVLLLIAAPLWLDAVSGLDGPDLPRSDEDLTPRR
jgi:hypothetical protein